MIEKFILLKNMTDIQGRKYDEDEVYSILKHEYYGEYGATPETTNLNLSLVSHRFVNVRVEDGDVIGNLDILNTPMGTVLKSRIDFGMKVRSSMRAIGNVSSDLVVSNIEIFGFDIVEDTKDS